MAAVDTLQRGRIAFEEQRWRAAFEDLSAADRSASLSGEDLERLAVAAQLTGRDAESSAFLARAFTAYQAQGNIAKAVESVFRLAMGLINEQEFALAGSWLARAQKLLDDAQLDCVERGFLFLPRALQLMDQGDFTASLSIFTDAGDLAERFDNVDLRTLSNLGKGQSLISLGRTTEGIARFDDVMVAITSGEVSPVVTGIVYCAVIGACQRVFDIQRAQEWTSALSHWCAVQPDLVPFRGDCLASRAGIMRLHGAWQDAYEEARRAADQLSHAPHQPALGAAFYEQGEIHRLRGEFVKAEAAYREATRRGRTPEPGLALLRLAQGQVDDAVAAMQRSLDGANGKYERILLLPAAVDVLLEAGNREGAADLAAELKRLAAEFESPFVEAICAQSSGAVLLANGETRDALIALRSAWAAWIKVDAPYEAARVRVWIGLGYRALGDADGAEMELDAARWIFEQLGAIPDAGRVESLSRRSAVRPAAGLTDRELQILRLVAAGKTNRGIAETLIISEKTVARHLSNIFAKLDLPSRAAATAYAYDHGLL